MPHHEKHPVAVPIVQKLEIAIIAVGNHHCPLVHGYLLGSRVVPLLPVRDEDVMRQQHVVVRQRVHLDGTLVGLVMRPVKNGKTQGDECRVQQFYGVLEPELLPFPERMLSKMLKAGIIDFLEHVGTPMVVLVGHGGLGRGLADAQVVKVPGGGSKPVADVTD